MHIGPSPHHCSPIGRVYVHIIGIWADWMSKGADPEMGPKGPDPPFARKCQENAPNDLQFFKIPGEHAPTPLIGPLPKILDSRLDCIAWYCCLFRSNRWVWSGASFRSTASRTPSCLTTFAVTSSWILRVVSRWEVHTQVFTELFFQNLIFQIP